MNTRISELLRTLDLELIRHEHDPRDSIPRPASDVSISLLSAFLSCELPDDVLEFFSIQDGEHHSAKSLVFGEVSGRVLPIREAIKIASFWRSEAAVEADDYYEAVGTVRKSVWRNGWLPLIDGSSLWVLDLDPPSDGINGQIFLHSPQNQRNTVVAPSLQSLLSRQIDHLRSGLRDIDDWDA